MTPEDIADQLSRLRCDARQAATAVEADASPLARAQAEADYIDAGLCQLAAELRGVCTVCTLGDEVACIIELTETNRPRWVN